MKLTCGSLFSGIGGFDEGFRRAGVETVWQVEKEEFCRKILARHFPEADRFDDIQTCCGFAGRRHYLQHVDIITAGVPWEEAHQ